ncbi:MAG: hypothetical protein HYS98_07570 [Deltaproteobacteria bacterium]|nr:hypothetical protein [Deltaproteobacteria bacterium]
MKEAIKILLVMTLFAGILLLMGCGQQEETVVSSVPVVNAPITNESSIQLGASTYVGATRDGRWVVRMNPSRRIDPEQFHGAGYVDIQVEVRDLGCNRIFTFLNKPVYMALGGVISTTFLGAETGNVKSRLTSSYMYGSQYPDGVNIKNILEGDVTLEIPESQTCEAPRPTELGAWSFTPFNNGTGSASERYTFYRLILE